MDETFYAALKISGVGMAGIFFFMLIIGAMITGLHRLFPGDHTKEKPAE